jgi:hypothetical protein
MIAESMIKSPVPEKQICGNIRTVNAGFSAAEMSLSSAPETASRLNAVCLIYNNKKRGVF